MRSCRLLFLLGGSAAFDVAAEEFIPAAGGCEAKIALLMQSGEGWEKHVREYTEPWVRRGVSEWYPVVPDANGVLDFDTVSAALRKATAIFIGGGHTPTYHRLYAAEPVRSAIRERYQEGVPVAGVSAGALIAPEVCALSPRTTGGDSLQIVTGLGLVRDLVVGVHFTERDALPSLLEAMAKTRTKTGWGIDGSACAVFGDEEFKGILGRSAYRIEIADFETMSYTAVECITAYSK